MHMHMHNASARGSMVVSIHRPSFAYPNAVSSRNHDSIVAWLLWLIVPLCAVQLNFIRVALDADGVPRVAT